MEEASRCPKCERPGKPAGNKRMPNGSKVFSFLCETELCRWYNTGWVVQVMADGSIPIRSAGQKDYPSRPYDERRAQAVIDQIQREAQRGEVPNPLAGAPEYNPREIER